MSLKGHENVAILELIFCNLEFTCLKMFNIFIWPLNLFLIQTEFKIFYLNNLDQQIFNFTLVLYFLLL